MLGCRASTRVRAVSRVLVESGLNLPLLLDDVVDRADAAAADEAASRLRSEQIAQRMESRGDNVNADAQAYHKRLAEKTTFDVCAICGVEESALQLMSKVDVAIPSDYMSKLRTGYRDLIAIGGGYATAVEAALDEDGLLRNHSFYCIRCVHAMKLRKRGKT